MGEACCKVARNDLDFPQATHPPPSLESSREGEVEQDEDQKPSSQTILLEYEAGSTVKAGKPIMEADSANEGPRRLDRPKAAIENVHSESKIEERNAADQQLNCEELDDDFDSRSESDRLEDLRPKGLLEVSPRNDSIQGVLQIDSRVLDNSAATRKHESHKRYEPGGSRTELNLPYNCKWSAETEKKILSIGKRSHGMTGRTAAEDHGHLKDVSLEEQGKIYRETSREFLEDLEDMSIQRDSTVRIESQSNPLGSNFKSGSIVFKVAPHKPNKNRPCLKLFGASERFPKPVDTLQRMTSTPAEIDHLQPVTLRALQPQDSRSKSKKSSVESKGKEANGDEGGLGGGLRFERSDSNPMPILSKQPTGGFNYLSSLSPTRLEAKSFNDPHTWKHQSRAPSFGANRDSPIDSQIQTMKCLDCAAEDQHSKQVLQPPEPTGFCKASSFGLTLTEEFKEKQVFEQSDRTNSSPRGSTAKVLLHPSNKTYKGLSQVKLEGPATVSRIELDAPFINESFSSMGDPLEELHRMQGN